MLLLGFMPIYLAIFLVYKLPISVHFPAVGEIKHLTGVLSLATVFVKFCLFLSVFVFFIILSFFPSFFLSSFFLLLLFLGRFTFFVCANSLSTL